MDRFVAFAMLFILTVIVTAAVATHNPGAVLPPLMTFFIGLALAAKITSHREGEIQL